MKILLLFVGLLTVLGCGHIKTRKQLMKPPADASVTVTTDDSDTSEMPREESQSLAVVLGPGSVRALSHAGFLQELERAKAPVVALAGIEWGALVAGFYAVSGSSTKLQWELQKINKKNLPSKGFLSNGFASEQPQLFLEKVLSRKILASRVERGGLPFSCPTAEAFDGRVKILTSGKLENVLSKCVASPPLLKPGSRHFAALFSVEDVIQQLEQQKAKTVLYVNVLHSGGLFSLSEMQEDPLAAYLWNQVKIAQDKALLRLRQKYSNFIVVNVDNSGQGLFTNRNSNMLFLAGQRAGKRVVEQLNL